MKTNLPIEPNGTLKALQRFFQALLTQGVVDLLLVPMRTPHGAVTAALVSDPALLVHADPLAPVMPSNAATLAGQVSARKPRPKVAAVLRSCELRALVELTKLQQASLDDLLLISIDCPGTYEVPDYYRLMNSSEPPTDDLWKALFQSPGDAPSPRAACRICEQPVYDQAQIVIELFNSDLDQHITISLPDELGEKLGFQPAQVDPQQRANALAALVAARTSARDAAFAEIRGGLGQDDSNLNVLFNTCMRCHNCMTVCPICYCKTCVFKSQVFDHDPMQYVAWARQKGACRMPTDTTLFHLTRLNHMALSCVGCGMCTQACPADLPVGSVFRVIGQRLQQVFSYQPGRDLAEKPPLITFKADEWTTVGE